MGFSRKYLPLGGVYHPIKVALPSNPTPRRSHPVLDLAAMGLAPKFGQQPRFSGDLRRAVSGHAHPNANFPTPLERGIRRWASPVHSPLQKGIPVGSFPPLIYMLKFSGLYSSDLGFQNGVY
ncbi:hypothetical protein JTE90_005151 [Oedothorax gibbosus]|uniref:Uncharacterized protein n=1 Tax=Oedothorax gibbosus TaxID=931172 RepID=A0AAV6TIB6_9ARAC|nr:hypothetical protein JTE90_005151 [Oedothorax gibbosus]